MRVLSLVIGVIVWPASLSAPVAHAETGVGVGVAVQDYDGQGVPITSSTCPFVSWVLESPAMPSVFVQFHNGVASEGPLELLIYGQGCGNIQGEGGPSAATTIGLNQGDPTAWFKCDEIGGSYARIGNVLTVTSPGPVTCIVHGQPVSVQIRFEGIWSPSSEGGVFSSPLCNPGCVDEAVVLGSVLINVV